MPSKTRKYSFAICGGVFGDEGKGRVVDEFVSNYAQSGRSVIVYRDNGGSNAGHTVEFAKGKKVALHQLPSGVFVKDAVCILGKGMVLHPSDLLEEMREAEEVCGTKLPAKIMIDELATVLLDTHRAFETVFKEGSKASTGRGISPAYADVLFRHPIQMRDLASFDQSKLKRHYQRYRKLIAGFDLELAEITVNALNNSGGVMVGSEAQFIKGVKKQAAQLKKYIRPVHNYLKDRWRDPKYGFVFEKAQAIGLDYRWGVYPDITASDTTFAGILYSTEGIVSPPDIEIKAQVIKATYMSSVGARNLPTMMKNKLAKIIREDANEYGATTKRPRDIAYLDLPALKFYAKIGQANCLVLTHMDIIYPDQPVKVCVDYKIRGKSVAYRPDQVFLNKVTPKYKEFKPWNREQVSQASSKKGLPAEAKHFLKFISRQLGLPILMITTGPRRSQGILFKLKLS